MRYSLRFGRVARPVEYESVKVEYEQDYDDEDIPREAAFDDLRNFVYKKLEEEMSACAEKYVRATEEAAKAPEAKPQREEGKPLEYYWINAEGLPWQAFREKRKAEPDEAAWIFTNTKGAEAMVDAINKEGAIFVRMGSTRFLCKIGGSEGQFINRTPQDKEKGK